MTIRGKYESDANFTTVYSNNKVYTIAGNGAWSSVAVGEMTASGKILTQETYDRWESGCTKEGEFDLP